MKSATIMLIVISVVTRHHLEAQVGDNVTSGLKATSGGWSNVATGDYSAVGGGLNNRARGAFSVVSGGGTQLAADSNSAVGNYSMILGGQGNVSKGSFSLAAGRRAKALYDGSFVWSDATGFSVESDTANQFKIRASNGVNIASRAGADKNIRLGDYYGDNTIVVWGEINADGTIGSSFGIKSVTHNSGGNYSIDVHVTAESPTTLIPVASVEVNAPPTSAASARLIYVDQVNTKSFNVYITNGNYSVTDSEFTVVVTAR